MCKDLCVSVTDSLDDTGTRVHRDRHMCLVFLQQHIIHPCLYRVVDHLVG